MIKIIGQTKLLNIVNTYSQDNLPKTIMFLGPKGCGKNTMAKYLSEHVGLELVDINEDVSYEQIEQFLLNPIRKIYLIDLDCFKEKQQNQFLKFIEEPSNTVNIILTATSENNVLQTILSRGIKFHFEEYTTEELTDISNLLNIKTTDLLLTTCRTPGQLLSIDTDSLVELKKLCTNIVDKINVANYANALGISTKINYKEDYNNFDFDIFLNMLEFVSFEQFKSTNSIQSLLIYNKLTQLRKLFVQANNPAKETFMIYLLTELWKEVRK